MTPTREHIVALQRLSSELSAGLTSLDQIVSAAVAAPDPAAPARTLHVPQETRDALAAVIRGLYGPMTGSQWAAIEAVLNGQPATPAGAPEIGLTRADFDWAASALGGTYAQIRAVDEVESGGGWFTDVRASILDLDGPGGFIDGPNLPKILFEAHKFDGFTKGRYRASHPNLSSGRWNRSLYVGGQGEWERLHRAMQLDEEAALKSASVGRYQIMGFNHALAGFPNVRAFWEAMKESERRHLEAFVAFIKNTNLTAAFRKISNVHADCIPFARGYNGSGYARHRPPYNVRIARAHDKFDG